MGCVVMSDSLSLLTLQAQASVLSFPLFLLTSYCKYHSVEGRAVVNMWHFFGYSICIPPSKWLLISPPMYAVLVGYKARGLLHTIEALEENRFYLSQPWDLTCDLSSTNLISSPGTLNSEQVTQEPQEPLSRNNFEETELPVLDPLFLPISTPGSLLSYQFCEYPDIFQKYIVTWLH